MGNVYRVEAIELKDNNKLGIGLDLKFKNIIEFNGSEFELEQRAIKWLNLDNIKNKNSKYLITIFMSPDTDDLVSLNEAFSDYYLGLNSDPDSSEEPFIEKYRFIYNGLGEL